MVMPLKPVARIVSFLAHLTSYDQPSSFTPSVQLQWCAQLTTKYPTAECAVTQVTPGSVNVATSMGFPANDNSASTLYAQLEAIASGSGSGSALFGSNFGPVTVTSVADSNNAPATTGQPPPPPPPPSPTPFPPRRAIAPSCFPVSLLPGLLHPISEWMLIAGCMCTQKEAF